MAINTIWSGLSTPSLSRIKIAEGHWKEQRTKGLLHLAISDGAQSIPAYRLPIMTVADLSSRIHRARQHGTVSMTVDTYLVLVHELEAIDDAIVDRVFAWCADDPCGNLPAQGEHADIVCRSVASFYSAMYHRTLIGPDGDTVRYQYKAANTISYRAYAPYQNIHADNRALIRPLDPDHRVLQFDWTAAEWSMIIQHCGYPVPEEDAYGVFTTSGIERDAAKEIVLKYIYGAGRSGLYDAYAPAAVDAVVHQMEQSYPAVLAWRDQISRTSVAEFEGFVVNLECEPYKRPNRWAQTALQLCKWELLHRLVGIGGHRLAAGDMHDSLIFHVDPVADMALARSVVAEIEKPCFGRYRLKPQFKGGEHWE
ncbi:MAG: hypothetical protein H0W83_00210 [Planctomycetes bacterium]|nr:hypothetical protein [Planctomycetota bacterium]